MAKKSMSISDQLLDSQVAGCEEDEQAIDADFEAARKLRILEDGNRAREGNASSAAGSVDLPPVPPSANPMDAIIAKQAQIAEMMKVQQQIIATMQQFIASSSSGSQPSNTIGSSRGGSCSTCGCDRYTFE